MNIFLNVMYFCDAKLNFQQLKSVVSHDNTEIIYIYIYIYYNYLIKVQKKFGGHV